MKTSGIKIYNFVKKKKFEEEKLKKKKIVWKKRDVPVIL